MLLRCVASKVNTFFHQGKNKMNSDDSIDIFKLKPVPSHGAILAAMSNPIMYRPSELARRFRCANASMHKALKEMAELGLVERGVKYQHSAYAKTGLTIAPKVKASSVQSSEIFELMEHGTYYLASNLSEKFGLRACNISAQLQELLTKGLIQKTRSKSAPHYFVAEQAVDSRESYAVSVTPAPYRPEWQPYLTPIKGIEKAQNDFRAGCEATR